MGARTSSPPTDRSPKASSCARVCCRSSCARHSWSTPSTSGWTSSPAKRSRACDERADMGHEVEWTATTLDGRYTGGQVTSMLDELFARVDALRARGEGYLEICRPDGGDYPAVFVGFRGERAVVHFFA